MSAFPAPFPSCRSDILQPAEYRHGHVRECSRVCLPNSFLPIGKSFAAIIYELGKRVIVVSHGATIEEICPHADPTSTMPRIIPNTSVSVIRISGVEGQWIPQKLGDVSQLKEDGFLQNAFGGDGASA